MARAAFVLLASVAVLAIVVRLLEPRLAFFPFRGETTTPRDFGLDFESLTVETRDGERLRAWLIPGTRHLAPSTQHPAPGTQHPFVVYFHGNGANLSNWAPILAAIARRGLSVLAFDYRGYGVSSGRPTEQGLYRDVEAILERAWASASTSQPIVYWGRSLGVSMAAYAARCSADLSGPPCRPPAGLILESGFPDARSLFRVPSPMAFLALFSSYRFPAAEFLRGVNVPALVVHGDADSVVPFEQGRALYERIEGPKQFFTVRGGDHNDAAPPDESAYWRTILGFVASLESSGGRGADPIKGP